MKRERRDEETYIGVTWLDVVIVALFVAMILVMGVLLGVRP